MTKAIKGASGSKDGVTLPARAASQARAGNIVRSRVGRSKPQISVGSAILNGATKPWQKIYSIRHI